MSYEIIAEGEEGKALIQFLEQLHFVTVKPLERSTVQRADAGDSGEDLPYFDAAPDWDIEASTLRASSNTARPASW